MEAIKRIGHVLPEEWIKKTELLLEHAGSERDAGEFIGWVVVLSFIFFIAGIALYFVSPALSSPFKSISAEITHRYVDVFAFIGYIIVLSVVYFLLSTMIYSYYALKGEMRRNAIETIVPDFLALVSSNVRGGMPLEQALWQAAKPEFGILAKEVKSAMKDSFSGVPIDEALKKLTLRFNSPLFERSMNILRESIKSGGEVATVLEKISEETRDVIIVKREMRSMLLIYVIFLVFASALGVPVLLAVSEKMVGTLQQSFTMSGNTGNLNGFIGFSISKPPFTEKEFHWFSIIMIFITTFITSFIVSVAYTGTKRQAFRFFPFMVITAYILYFVSLGVVGYILMNIV